MGNYCIGTCCQQTTDKGFVISGKYSWNAGGNGIFVLKTDSMGIELWTYKNTTGIDGQVNSIRQSKDGGYIAAGSYYTINTDNNFWLIKLKRDPTNIHEENYNLIGYYNLYQNYPNPFNPVTTIKYQVPKSGLITLKIYDILGQEVTTLVNENKVIGFFEVNFDASRLPSGVYIYQLRVNDFIASKKMILLK